MDKHKKYFISNNLLLLKDDVKRIDVYIIVGFYGLQDLLLHFKKVFSEDRIQLYIEESQQKINSMYLNNPGIIKYYELLKKISDTEYILNFPFKPKHYIYKMQLKDIPELIQNIIPEIKFWLSSGNICGVKIKTKHPNCDADGFYCVHSSIKFSTLNDLNIDQIINNMKVWNLDQGYYIPAGLNP